MSIQSSGHGPGASPLPSEAAALAVLRAENEALRVRLAAAEERLGAGPPGETGAQTFSLRQAECHFRLLAEMMNQGAAIAGEDGTLLWANPRWADILRLTPAQLTGTTLGQFLPDHACATYQAWLANADADAVTWEFIVLATDGSPVPVYLTPKRLPPETGAATALIMTDLSERLESETLRRARLAALNLMQDEVAARQRSEQANARLQAEIVERRRAELALRASEERLKLGIQVAGLALAEIDYRTGLNHLSDEAARLYGLGDAALAVPRESVHATFHLDDRPALQDAIAACLDPAGPGWFDLDHRIVWPDGQVRWLRVRKQVFFTDIAGERRPVRAKLAAFDVTAAKVAAEAVRQSEVFVRAVLNSLPQQVVVLDEAGLVRAVNESWERFACANSGSPLSVSVGANYLEVYRRSAADGDMEARHALEGLEDLLAGRREQYVLEYPCHGPDHKRWFMMHAKVPLPGLPGVIISHIDISELKLAEEALRESEERMRMALRVSHAYAFEWDLLSDRVSRSAGCGGVLGLPAQKERYDTGHIYVQRIHRDDRQRFRSLLAGLKPGADTYHTQYRLIRADGREAVVAESARGFFDDAGRLQRLIGATTDITKQKLAAQALQETELRFRQMAEAIGDVFWLCSPDWQNILYISPAFEQVWGQPCEAVYAQPTLWLDAILPEDLPQVTQGLESLACGGNYDVEFRIVRPDGSQRWISDRGYPSYDRDGNVVLTSGVASDITERKQMEMALRDSEARMRLALEVSHTSAFEWNPATDCVRRSGNFGAVLGMPLEEARFDTGQGYFQRIHPDDRPCYLALLDGLTPDADSYHKEYRLLRADGGESTVAESARGFFDAAGHLQRLVGATTDITEHTQTAQALHEVEQRFQKMADTIGEVFWMSSADGKTLFYLTPGVERLLGRKREELYANPGLWQEALLPEDVPKLLACHAELLATGRLDTEYRIRHPDGRVRWINDRGCACLGSEGQIISVSGVASDITERKRMEQTLCESEIRFRSLFESSGDAIGLLGEAGFAECNDAALRMFGCAARADLLGKNPGQFSPPTQPGGGDSITLANERIAAAFAAGSLRFDWQHRRLDGSEFSAEILLTRIELQGRPVLQATVRDISQHKAMLEAMAQAKAAAEQANQSKSAFLANMSHEIRTPMNAIIGFTELCLTANPTERQRNYLGKIKSASEALLHVINDILDFSKIEADKLEMLNEPFSPAQLFDHVVSMLAEKAQDKGLALADRIDPALENGAFLGDARRLGQVLINLVGNAIKFSRRGQVLLSVALAGSDEGQAVLHFTVRDEGIGVAPEKQALLFQPFSQADASTTRHYGGTGLGLAISRRLVEIMGGRIWMDSAPGQGSTFHFTARFARCDHAPPPPPPGRQGVDGAALARLRGADILLVEDAELNQEVIRDLLQQVGICVRLAVNGEEALREVAKKLPDAVLMDCQMPVMDGFEATRRLRAQPQCRHLPIIALTANAMSGDRERCFLAGMDGFVAKPVDFAELYASLAQRIRPSQTPVSHASSAPTAASAPDSPALPDLPGIDIAAGLMRVGGKMPFYVKILKKFRASNASDFAALFREAQAAGDWDTALRVAHNLKGVARTLGAERLGDLAEQMEQTLSQGALETVAERLDALLIELGRVMAGIGGLDDAGAESAPLFDSARCQTLVRDLGLLLEDHDTAAVEHIRSLELALAGSDYQAEAQAIGLIIARYNFAEARARLGHLAQALNLAC